MLTVAAATCVLAGVAQAQSVKDVIESRQANYKKTGANAQAIKKALDTGTDLKAVAVNAQEIADWATKIPTVFPVGSGPESGIKTAALATIWQDKPDFEKKAAGLHDAAMKLVVALNTGDKAAVAPAFQAMGGTCGACHQTYRAKQ
jgi:cytochrome c556